MGIINIGPWFLLVIGVATLILALVRTYKSGVSKGKWYLWVFGFALCGVAIWGPQFFSPYSSFLQTISELYPIVSDQSASDALKKISRGELSPEYSNVVAWYIIDHAPEKIDSILASAIEKSTDTPGKEMLINIQEILRGRRQSASIIREALQSSEDANLLIDKLDPLMQSMVATEIIRLPDSVRMKVNIKDENLFSMKEKKYQLLKGMF